MTILENIDKDILENIDIDIDIDKDILENIDIDIDIDMGISENIDIDINIDKDILSEKIHFFQQKVELFSCFYDEILISIVDISAFFEISMKYGWVFLKILLSTKYR